MTEPAAASPRTIGSLRLTSGDAMYLRLETEDWPCHFGGLVVLDGTSLHDDSGRLRLPQILQRLEERLADLPKLRSRIMEAGPLGGRPVWVRDTRFAIERHVHIQAIDPPGDEQRLLDVAADLYGRLLPRDRPLWELWIITGIAGNRVGALVKLHHAVADGLGAVAVLGSLLETDSGTPRHRSAPADPPDPPSRWSLLGDNLSAKARATARAVKALAHPIQAARMLASFVRLTKEFFGTTAAPGSSVNEVVRRGRRIRLMTIDLEEARHLAHQDEGKINDLVLTLWAGGLRSLLTSRGESTESLDLVAGVPASHRSDDVIDNQTGTLVVPLPVWEPDPRQRLRRIGETTRRLKDAQRPAAIMGYLAGLAGTPIGRWFTTRQRATNTIVTNVIGPPWPVFLLGAPALQIIPIIQLVGNIGLTMCAFSYQDRLSLVVTADVHAFPDLDVLVDGMRHEWSMIEGRDHSQEISHRGR